MSRPLLGLGLVVPWPHAPQAPSHGGRGLGRAPYHNAAIIQGDLGFPHCPRGAFGCPGGETEAAGEG